MSLAPKAKSLARWRFHAPADTSFAVFASACKAAKGRNLVQELLDPFMVADAPPDVAAALAGFKARPWYSAAELARLWPLVCVGLAQKRQRTPTPDKLAKALVAANLPRLKQWDGSTEFRHFGKPCEFFIVQDVWRIASQRYTQADFDRIMSQ